MKCNNCNKEQGRPLELYNGAWACPYCREERKLPELCFTPENRELYAMAEYYYSEWLIKSAPDMKKSERKILRIATDLCRQSAEKGNPLAIIRMAYYYDKDYVELNYTEVMRCKIAYKYYSYVCFYELNVPSDSMENMADIKRRAARLMLEMLANAPYELTKAKKYNYKSNCEKVVTRGILNKNEIEKPTNTEHMEGVSAADTVMRVLGSCYSKYRAMLFSIIRVTGGDLKDIKNNNKYWENFCKIAMDGVDIYYVPVSGGTADRATGLVKLRGNSNIYNIIEGLKEQDNLRLVILNGKGRHRFFGSSQRKNIFGCLTEDDEGEALFSIIDANKIDDRIFYDDDIYIYKNRRSYKAAIDCLIESFGRVEE